jgi:3-isopropylmalate/(R)-2-methylmalate dehydratase large subunit
MRVLYLTRDATLVARQLAGEKLTFAECTELADDVSTDEMAPAWACYYFDERLATYCLCGFRTGVVTPGSVQQGGFGVLVGGESFGSGSSRETAPFAQRAAGIRFVVARSFERIYRQNCHNLGLFTSTDLSLLEEFEAGISPDVVRFTAGLDALSAEIVLAGGLGAYGRERRQGRRSPPGLERAPRPLTLAEKVLASHWVAAPGAPGGSAPSVAPGDVGFARADVRFSHDYVTAMIDAQLRSAFGPEIALHDQASIFLFRDHLTLLPRVMPEAHRRLGLLEQSAELAETQRAFARRHGLKLYDEREPGKSEGICHNLVVEELAEPGQVVVGTDSHTCMAGALGAFAFGVGSTEMAAGLVTGDFRVAVPASARIEVIGRLGAGVAVKDAWLGFLAREEVRQGALRGRVLEFGGEGFQSLPIDERATFCNMAAEAGAFTAIAEADEAVLDFIARERGADRQRLAGRVLRPDPGAVYERSFRLDLTAAEPTVALPGDPKNGVGLRGFLGREKSPKIDIAYGGSCTGGKRSDMDMYAAVLGAARARGFRVAPGVELFIQFGSQRIHRHAIERGYVELFEGMGATLLDPACGACISAGPGVSRAREQVTVSAINRNFEGRSGPGRVYLASPYVVAASAIAGELATADRWLGAEVTQ